MIEFILENINNIIAFFATIILTIVLARIARRLFTRFLSNLEGLH